MNSLKIKIFSSIARFLPMTLVQWLNKQSSPIAKRIAHYSVTNRDITIPEGVGSGLKFNIYDTILDYALGTYEYPTQNALKHYIKPGDTIYDIGANIGFFTVMCAKLTSPTGHVYAFEPVHETEEKLKRNIDLNKLNNVTILEKAVSDHSGKSELRLNKYCGATSLVEIPIVSRLKGIAIVEVVSIDELIDQKVLIPPDLVKIDVEGAEFDVLHGMEQTIRTLKPIIICEIDDKNKESFMYKQEEINSFMGLLDYNTRRLEDYYRGTEWNVGHIIAIPK